MNRIKLGFIIICMFLGSCRSSIDNPENLQPLSVPTCVQAKIDLIKNSPVWNPPATVYSYMYHNQVVYSFSADCCDQFITVYDNNCNLICSPSGGITGSGDGKCSDFQKMATDEMLIWKDDRKR